MKPNALVRVPTQHKPSFQFIPNALVRFLKQLNLKLQFRVLIKLFQMLQGLKLSLTFELGAYNDI
jgi:hypothetical protein